LEFARQCANSFNYLFAKPEEPVLHPPDTIISPAKRVMSLTNPLKKMSKSDTNPASRILINDSTPDVVSKIRTAVTDSDNSVSYDPQKRPGVSNLIDLLFHLKYESEGATSPNAVAEDNSTLSLKALKEKVVDTIDDHLAPIREQFNYLNDLRDMSYIGEVSYRGTIKARSRARLTMNKVKAAVAIDPYMFSYRPPKKK
jgi:tryptophanyl-tRNA synthetase